jgi:hypothetical protein
MSDSRISRKTGTSSLPSLPPGARLIQRLRSGKNCRLAVMGHSAGRFWKFTITDVQRVGCACCSTNRFHWWKRRT